MSNNIKTSYNAQIKNIMTDKNIDGLRTLLNEERNLNMLFTKKEKKEDKKKKVEKSGRTLLHWAVETKFTEGVEKVQM